jgi:predicted amidohydrolase YtcJ
VLKESAQGLVRRLIPARTAAESDQGIRELAKAFNAEGMTGAKDPGISDGAWNAYRRVQAEGGLTLRVFALWSGGNTAEGATRLIAQRATTTRPYESTGDDHLISGGVKLFIDGSGGARTAWMYTDWNKNFKEIDKGNRGYPASDPEVIRAMILQYHEAGLHVSTHAIGDRAIDWIVDTYAMALKRKPTRGLRHGLIHANIPTDRAIDLIAELQRTYDAAYPEPSATFTWWIGDTYAGNFGPARAQRLNPFATFRAKGIQWANGSDFSVTPFPARYGLWSAVARETLLSVHGSTPFGTKESVDVRTALRAVTIWAARQMFLEQKIGSIEPGKYADLAVWDRDPYSVPTGQLKEMQCQLTIFNGKVVYRR